MLTKFIIVNPYDFILYLKPYSHPLRMMSQLFYKINSIDYMKDHGIEVISLVSFLDDANLKYELRDYNTCEKYFDTNDTSKITNFQNYFRECVKKFMTKVKQQLNMIILLFMPFSQWDLTRF